jgi:alanyl-tRNA synthetase
MKTAEIRSRFLDYFRERGHEIEPSSSLVPTDDQTLLFTNAGMVQFKRVFLGQEDRGFRRATSSQKCVRAGGKHNDLEEVGRTARHHTFFEMLGNFSFGDYFKRDAIHYAWELLTEVYGLDAERLYATVHHSDDEAADLWANEIGLPPERIYRLGDKDNFWQMADTGPCGPCSELHYDLREHRAPVTSVEEFVELNDSGIIVELWNLVFMQFDRDAEGTLHALPAPCVDTGAGLERIAAVLQGVDSNYHADLFVPLLERVAELVGRPYEPDTEDGVSYRVLVDHARAVTFLLSDGVYPSNEGRGYVLRRILRRGVRHAWMLGRREPTLVGVVEAVIEGMGATYPDLVTRRDHIVNTTRAEEERFLTTIEGGLARFAELAAGDAGTIGGDEVFKLYDTFGFPMDLTQLMAEEKGYEVDVEGFEKALDAQRARSRADRAASGSGLDSTIDVAGWTTLNDDAQEFVGYERTSVDTEVLSYRFDGRNVGLTMRENPFYVESGGQVADEGHVRGQGWSLTVRQVAKLGASATALFGEIEGSFPTAPSGPVDARAEVAIDPRNDMIRNHTATHLLHAALRTVLGEHVVQRGSLVNPDRLRFDFAHTAPMTESERTRVETIVNEGVWADHPVQIDQRSYVDAVAAGAMALFGEKYADEVRVVHVPGVSMELCGGTHVASTGNIGFVRIVSESGVAAGVRRIEARTGRGAHAYFAEQERVLAEAAAVLKTQPESLTRRVEQLLSEKAELENLLSDLRAQGGSGEQIVVEEVIDLGAGLTTSYRGVRLKARGVDDARSWGDSFLSSGESGIAVLVAEMPGPKQALLAFVTDDMITRGVRADAVVRDVAAVVGGRGGGRPHMAQAGVEDATRLNEALSLGVSSVRSLLGNDTA